MLEHGWNPDEEPQDSADSILFSDCGACSGERVSMRIDGQWYWSCSGMTNATLLTL